MFEGYNQSGEVTLQTLTGILGPQPDRYTFSFTKESGLTSLESSYSISNLHDDLAYYFQNDAIASHFAWYELDRLVQQMDTFPNDVASIKTQFTQLLTTFSEDISPHTDAYLRAKIERL